VVPSSTGSVVVVVVEEILEGHVNLRFEDSFLGPPPQGSMGFLPSSHNPHVFYWVCFACAITMGKKKPSTPKLSTLVF
jgi:hypothetical protein